MVCFPRCYTLILETYGSQTAPYGLGNIFAMQLKITSLEMCEGDDVELVHTPLAVATIDDVIPCQWVGGCAYIKSSPCLLFKTQLPLHPCLLDSFFELPPPHTPFPHDVVRFRRRSQYLSHNRTGTFCEVHTTIPLSPY